MASYTLHTPPGSFRAFKALIAAEYNSIDVTVADWDAGVVKSVSPTGKAPALETKNGVIFESNAIARFIAGLRTDNELLGGTVYDRAVIDSWVDFAANDVELPACVWFYPVAGYMPFQEAAYEKAKTDLAAALTLLNTHLTTKTYLVGDQITLADICVVSALVYPMKLVCDKTFLKPFGNVVRWFTTCVNQPAFKAVIGECPLAKKELTAAGQTAKAAPADGGGKKKKGKKGGDKKAEKKEKAAPDPLEPAPVKKVDHPYKIMDKASPSPFSMDKWKKTYSNAATYEEGMAAFWEMFDPKGWSIWHMNYNYNDENKRVFMAGNAVGGFQQRSDEIRKWAFGVMDVLGQEDPCKIEIKGIWLFRGDTVDHMKQANDDANWYTWTKLAGQETELTEETKLRVYNYWCQENELEGMPIADSKVFK